MHCGQLVGAVVLGTLVVLSGCGADDGEPVDPADPTLGRCVSCDSELPPEEEVEWQPSTAVWISPGELMFYGELSRDELPPQEVLLVNETPGVVTVTDTYVADDTMAVYGTGSANYFVVQGLEGPTTLQPGDKLSLWVSFMPSDVQRAALLVVETTDEAYSSLEVSLQGKYFLETSF